MKVRTALMLADAPEDDGTFLLFYVDESGVTHKCGLVWAEEENEVREALEALPVVEERLVRGS